jgi:hypothetical protein
MNKEHRTTEAECTEAWRLFADREKYLSLSDAETIMVDAFVEAGQMFHDSGAWPTLAEVEQKWMQEAAERARKRDVMIAECAAHSEQKKA